MFYFVNMYVGANMLPKNMLRESWRKTICSLALNGESTQYELKPLTELNYASIHEAINQLLASKLIKETKQEPGPGPVPKRFFSLTLKGLVMAFKITFEKAETENVNMKELLQCIDKIAKKCGHLLPLVLGKWRHFESAGLEREFIKAFQWVIMWFLEWGYDTEAWATERFLYFIFVMAGEGALKVKWVKALYEDSELRQCAIKGLKEWLWGGIAIMDVNNRTLEKLEMTNEPDWNKVDLRIHAPKGYPSLSGEELRQWVTEELKKYEHP